ncbi:MAG: deoxyribonuclease IV [Proteobacteria bacterium]|nr:deoxyribonuclease IV [Pseudomonadota bacterium]
MIKKKGEDRLLGVHCSIAGGVENAALAGGALGCTAIQLFTGSNKQWSAPPIDAAHAEAFRRAMKEQGIKTAVAHACYLINLAAPDRAIYSKSIRAMTAEIERAHLLGIPWVIVHPGSHKGKGLEWGIERIADAANRAFADTDRLSAGIALETTAGQGASIGGRFEELAAIIDKIDDKGRAAVCFDTCHAFAAGYELRTKRGYDETWRLFDSAVGMKRLVAMHLNDSKGKLGSRVDRHTHVGEGEIGLAGFRLIMNDPRLARVPMLLETPKGDDAEGNDDRNLWSLRRLISSRSGISARRRS